MIKFDAIFRFYKISLFDFIIGIIIINIIIIIQISTIIIKLGIFLKKLFFEG